MNTVYRTYEVLIEETLLASDSKQQKTSKPSRENLKTRRALETTHRIFQDAVCYYILCLIGLVRDAQDVGPDGSITDVNPLWRTLTTGEQGKRTNELVRQFIVKYPNVIWQKKECIEDFLSGAFGSNLADNRGLLIPIYRQLRAAVLKQIKNPEANENEGNELGDMARFASDWMQRLSNQASEQAGSAAKATNNSYWVAVREKLQGNREQCDDVEMAENIELARCFDSPVTELRGIEAFLDYSRAFGITLPKHSLWKNAQEVPKAVIKFIRSIQNENRPEKSKEAFPFTDFGAPLATLLQLTAKATKPNFTFSGIAAKSGAKPSGTYWYVLRYKFWPCEVTRKHLLANLKTRAVVSSEDPIQDVRDLNGRVFPFFTHLLGIPLPTSGGSIWPAFDKSAFKRAAEEVFKYRIRSNKRRADYQVKANRVHAMEGRGEWKNAKGAPTPIGGLLDDPRGPLMKRLLAELGGSIGYGLRRSTIGGWRDLREDFLKASNDGDPDGEKLEALVAKAQTESGGGFGSAALFKKLCEPDYFPLWQESWESPRSWHAKNFLAWYVRYTEAREELKALAEIEEGGSESDEDAETRTAIRLKPISITLPGTENRHGDVSFRPLDFDCRISPHPHFDLFDRDETGAYRVVRTNAALVNDKFKDGDYQTAEYPLTLSYRRLKRDRITLPDGSSMEAFYQPPLVIDDAPDFHKEAKAGETEKRGAKKRSKARILEVSSSLLPPSRESGPFHLSLALPVNVDGLAAETPKIIEEKHSVRSAPPLNGKFAKLYFRWPVDAETEKRNAGSSVEGDDVGPLAVKATKVAAGKLWCVKDFEPFHILSVDLGVRFAGAWCRAKIFKGEPKIGQRVISAEMDEAKTGKIAFGVEHVGTFRLQGEDVKLWRKKKGQAQHTFEQEPCGSRGRRATDTEISTFIALAKAIIPESPRTPLPDTAETKYFPQLAGHLQFRLARRLGQLRMLFNLRWRAVGRVRKDGHVYRELSGDELADFQLGQRLRAIEMLDFKPREDVDVDREELHMEKLRLALGNKTEWEKLTFTFNGKQARLFGKQRTKSGKAAQEAAQRELRAKLAEPSSPWNWDALSSETSRQIDEAMISFEGATGLMARTAHFVWPLIKKRWVWQPCERDKSGRQSVLGCVEDQSAEVQNITGMRGLNMRRIELLQEFRRCCQSLAKLERRYHRDEKSGVEPSPVRERDIIHEPAPAWLDKVNELREQRVNQTAHLILAEALGLALMNPDEVEIEGLKKAALKNERDVHGRYQKNPEKPRVAAIVLEDLSRYRTSQDRSRFENRQLMEWSHRQVLIKLQDMAQVFGIPIFTVDARFSSRFSSRTGVPGIRCIEVSKGFETEHPWKKWMEETVVNPHRGAERIPSARAVMIRDVAHHLADADAEASLILPLDGGPSFLPVVSHLEGHEGLEANADINAAVTVGLRAVAHPDRLDVFPLLRAAPKCGGVMEIRARRGRFTKATESMAPVSSPDAAEVQQSDVGKQEPDDDEVESGKIRYLFSCPKVDGRPALTIPESERYKVSRDASAAVSKIYWKRVKQECVKRLADINNQRLARWRHKRDTEKPVPGNPEL